MVFCNFGAVGVVFLLSVIFFVKYDVYLVWLIYIFLFTHLSVWKDFIS